MTYPEKNLAKFLGYSISSISKYLGLQTRFIFSSEFDNGFSGKNKILPLLSAIKCTTYVNMIGGQSLYSTSDFQDYHIKLLFLKFKEFYYQQNSLSFNPFVSIIDLCFNMSVESIKSSSALVGELL